MFIGTILLRKGKLKTNEIYDWMKNHFRLTNQEINHIGILSQLLKTIVRKEKM